MQIIPDSDLPHSLPFYAVSSTQGENDKYYKKPENIGCFQDTQQ